MNGKAVIGGKCYELWLDRCADIPEWRVSEYTIEDITQKGYIRVSEGDDAYDPEYDWLYPNAGYMYRTMYPEDIKEFEDYPTFFYIKEEAEDMKDKLNNLGYVDVQNRQADGRKYYGKQFGWADDNKDEHDRYE